MRGRGANAHRARSWNRIREANGALGGGDRCARPLGEPRLSGGDWCIAQALRGRVERGLDAGRSRGRHDRGERHGAHTRRAHLSGTRRPRGSPCAGCGVEHSAAQRHGVNILDQFRFLSFGWRDAIEIAVVAYGMYRLLLLLHGTRAVQMLIGIVVLVLTYALAWIFKFTMITYLLGVLFTYGAFAALVIFQPELRAALARLGQSRVTRFFKRMDVSEVAEEIADAVERLSRSSIGCIIALEREIALGDYVASGTEMQAKVSGPVGHDLHAVLAAARRRRDHPRRHDHRRRVHPAAHAGADDRPHVRHAPPRRARLERGDGRAGGGGVRGERDDLGGAERPAAARSHRPPGSRPHRRPALADHVRATRAADAGVGRGAGVARRQASRAGGIYDVGSKDDYKDTRDGEDRFVIGNECVRHARCDFQTAPTTKTIEPCRVISFPPRRATPNGIGRICSCERATRSTPMSKQSSPSLVSL